MMHLPTLNAFLNSLSAFFILAGYFFIRRKNQNAHRNCMLLACATSVVFLISYLTYHFQHGVTRYQKTGLIRFIYFFILSTHTFLAFLVPFLVGISLFWAFRKNWVKHTAITRFTLPVWLYVSVTGVIVYLMLYQL